MAKKNIINFPSLEERVLSSYELNDTDDVSTERLLAMVADDCNCSISDVIDILSKSV